MDILWSSEALSIKEVQSILNQESPISINTVMTVMNRLLDKGLLTKVMTGTGRTRAPSLARRSRGSNFSLNRQRKCRRDSFKSTGAWS